jgi:hypothetical protein
MVFVAGCGDDPVSPKAKDVTFGYFEQDDDGDGTDEHIYIDSITFR